jgi:2-C-methyl-D-erythritol 2,4-cyclodiphosphate synthase
MTQPSNERRRKVIAGLTPARKSDSAPSGSSNPTQLTIPFRIGHGYDIHRLQAGGKLALGGVVVSDEISPIAHSDGDVVIHALVDALLGAMGWGDIGQMFPDSDEQWRGAASRVFIETVYRRVREAGFALSNADITILAERPRLGPFKLTIAQTLRELFGGAGTINIKAGTNEGCGEIGRGEAIAAHAVVLLAQVA